MIFYARRSKSISTYHFPRTCLAALMGFRSSVSRKLIRSTDNFFMLIIERCPGKTSEMFFRSPTRMAKALLSNLSISKHVRNPSKSMSIKNWHSWKFPFEVVTDKRLMGFNDQLVLTRRGANKLFALGRDAICTSRPNGKRKTGHAKELLK